MAQMQNNLPWLLSSVTVFISVFAQVAGVIPAYQGVNVKSQTPLNVAKNHNRATIETTGDITRITRGVSFLKTLLSLYLFTSVTLTQYFAAYFFSKAKTSYWKAFSALAVCVSVYLFGYLMIINSSNLQVMIFWNQIQYLCLPFVSVLWFLVALLYTKTIYTLKSRMTILLFVAPVLTFFMRLTNNWHHLFYKTWELKQAFGGFALSMERGCWYYVNICVSALYLLWSIVIYYLGYYRNKTSYNRPQFRVFLFASLLPFIGIIFIVFIFQERNIDYVALVIPASLCIVAYGIFKYDFLAIKTLARETIFENSPAAMVIMEPGPRIVDYNKAAREFFGKLNISLDNHSIKLDLQKQPELLGIFNSESSRELSLTINGVKRHFEISSVPLDHLHDRNMRLLKSINDITDNKNAQEKLRMLATTDSLSGLYNQAEFLKAARAEFIRAKNSGEIFSFLMIDLDHFKSINDTFGHAAGDEVIRKIGEIIKACFRKTDITGRLGGEEFAVVLKNTSLEEAVKTARQFLEMVAGTTITHGMYKIGLTLSIGVATSSSVPEGDNAIENILKRADDALYKAKAKGRNRVEPWNE